jgi:heavy metal sensor kinase
MRHHLLSLTDAGLAEELTELADEVSRAPSPAVLGPRYAQHEGYELQISVQGGTILFRSDRLGRDDLRKTGVLDLPDKTSFTTAALGHLGRMRIASRTITAPSGRLTLQAATSLAPFDDASSELLTVLLLVGGTALAASIGIGYLLAMKALAPVDRMVTEAADITSTRLARRLEVPRGGDELARLARTLNDMIERLERSFTQVRRFTADAAHELRTPLAVIRTSAEVALREPRCAERDQRVLEELLSEAERLGRIVGQLLGLCREDHDVDELGQGTVHLNSIVYEVVDLMQIAAEEKGIVLDVEKFPSASIRGDEDRLRQLFINLLDNAIKYTDPGGSVLVCGKCSGELVTLEVSDTGCGISEQHLPHVFERFYRADESRSRETEGTGLGLAICRSIADAHRGELTLTSTHGIGSKVSLTLPVSLIPSGVPG